MRSSSLVVTVPSGSIHVPARGAGREDGTPPPVDLEQEKTNGDFVRMKIRKGLTTAVHDISDGGLVAALADMALASGIGCKIELPAISRRMLSCLVKIRLGMC